MKSPVSTPSSAQKPKRNFLAEFLPLYKKSGENYATQSTDENSAKKLDISSSNIKFDSPKRQRPSNKYQDHVKQPVEVTQSTSGAGCSTPLANQQSAKFVKARSKKKASAIEHSQTMDNDSVNLSNSLFNKRSKSVSFLTEENNKSLVKKHKSNILNEEASDNAGKPVKKAKKQEKTKQSSEFEITKRAKKQKHQEKPEIENEEPKTEVLVNLENLNLGDNSHTLPNLIDEMAVVDKKKLKKLKKTANRENKLEDQHQTNDKSQNLNETGNSEINGEMVEKKKWASKRWNKHQVAKRDQNTSLIVDNLPVSLLNGNYKKVLIDHFSKYGLSSVGEPVIQNEEDPNGVFTTKVFFDTVDSAAEALEMDETTIAGNEIQVSQMRPLTETAIVLRIYGPIEKFQFLRKDIIAMFRDVGLIRSIRPLVKKKKTMSTVVVEFDSPETVKRALEKCADLTIYGLKIMANKFVILKHKSQEIKTEKRKRQRGGKKGAKKINKNIKGDDVDSDSNASDE